MERERPFKPKPPEDELPQPLSEVAPRDDVRAAHSPTRCPYCHGGIEVRDERWVACAGCLARHHQECWSEHGACSGCGSAEAMVRAGAETQVRPGERDGERGWTEQLESLANRAEVLVTGQRLVLDRGFELDPPQEGFASSVLGTPLTVEVERRLAGPVPAERCGTWSAHRLASVHLGNEGEAGLLRMRVSLGNHAGALFGGLIGGLGGGLGGGLAVLPQALFGGIGVIAWILLCFVGSYLLARALLARESRRTAEKIATFLEAVEAEL